ncbi:endonuclease I family protein [Myroides sp. DW712]|uniref:endonuclease I family protein n=1 Tax=Myroides sp. DW712 TaxID=3389800 RepID=UPI003978BF30
MRKYYLLVTTLVFALFVGCSKDDSPTPKKPDPEGPTVPTTPGSDIVKTDTYNYIPTHTAEVEYYNGVNFKLRGDELKSALRTVVTRTHKPQNYSPNVWYASIETDRDPENPNNVLLVYGWPKGTESSIIQARSMDKNARNHGGYSDERRQSLWEREHVFAKSLANPKLITNSSNLLNNIAHIAGTDAHNLRPINGEWNNTRSNLKFTDGQGNSGRRGSFWYPGDEWKGDVARMMMYMYLRYDKQCKPGDVGDGMIVYSGDRDEMIELFLKWNAEDPVSPIERKRNEYHGNPTNTYSQGNRNPFIDNPYLANLIWGTNYDRVKVSENTWERR